MDDDSSVLGGVETINGNALCLGGFGTFNLTVGVLGDRKTGLLTGDVRGKFAAVSLLHIVEHAFDTTGGEVHIVVIVAERAGETADGEFHM